MVLLSYNHSLLSTFPPISLELGGISLHSTRRIYRLLYNNLNQNLDRPAVNGRMVLGDVGGPNDELSWKADCLEILAGSGILGGGTGQDAIYYLDNADVSLEMATGFFSPNGRAPSGGVLRSKSKIWNFIPDDVLGFRRC